MAVEWVSGTSNVSIMGVTTIRWGTRGMFGSAIVESADEAEDTEKYYVDQGDGMHASRILIRQGHSYDFTVVDDSAIFSNSSFIPVSGSNVAITEMLATGSTIVRAYGTYISGNYSAAKKTEGKRIMHIENMILIDSQGAPSVPAF